ncbi:hypothetical protein Tco_1261669 [Tanacetum coccineum]
MRIEQYFLMIDYALWEVILNGDSPLPTRIIDGVETSVPPTTAEQKLARKNELKARGTLLMALPNEHQLNFNTYKSAKTLMEAIEKSTNEAIKTAHGVSAANSKDNASTLPNVDSLSEAVIYSFFTNGNADNESKDISQNYKKQSRETTRRTVPIEETTSNALVSQCDGFGYDWSDQAEERPTNFALMAYTSSSSSSSDTESQLNVGAYKAGLELIR